MAYLLPRRKGNFDPKKIVIFASSEAQKQPQSISCRRTEKVQFQNCDLTVLHRKLKIQRSLYPNDASDDDCGQLVNRILMTLMKILLLMQLRSVTLCIGRISGHIEIYTSFLRKFGNYASVIFKKEQENFSCRKILFLERGGM